MFVTPTTSRTNIAVALAPFLVAHRRRLAITPSLDAVHRHPSQSFTVHCHAIHHRQVAIALSLSVHHHCDRSPSPSRSCCPSPYIAIKEPSRHPLPSRSCCAIHCHRAVPSTTVEEPSIAVNQSTAFKSPSLRPLMPIAVESPLCRSLSSHCAVHHRQVAIVPSFAVHCRCNHSPSASLLRHSLPSIATKEPSHLPSPSSRHRAVHHLPSLSITVVIAVHHHRHHDRAVPRSIAVEEPPRCPSPSRSHRAVH